jgi:EAL domain-containing protein (putative c-di-GMP-specific phosphodiesterase class I)
MRTGGLFLAWQPIRNAACLGRHLYEECLLRFIGDEGAVVSAGESIAALERLGLVRTLDLHVMNRVIDLLEVDHDRRVGVNLSMLSLVRDAWWGSTIDRLVRDPAIARRIHVEITETAEPSDLDRMTLFVGQLREAGCPLVLDDFGAGFSGLRLLNAVQPDIVKLDRSFLREAADFPGRRRALAHLCDYLGAVGALVVAEGVESASDSAIANEAGAHWQQGYHFGAPSFSRTISEGRPKIASVERDADTSCSTADVAEQILDGLSVAWGSGPLIGESGPMSVQGECPIGQSILAAPSISGVVARKSGAAFPERAPSPVGYWL